MGSSYAAIGAGFALSRERVRQVYMRTERMSKMYARLRCLNCWHERWWYVKTLFKQHYRFTCSKCSKEHGIYQNDGYQFVVADMRSGIC